MSPEHGARRSRVILVEPALTQLAKLTASETHRLDRAIVAISVNPALGTEVPGTLLRDYDVVSYGCQSGIRVSGHELRPGCLGRREAGG
ncbi:hypothetical protein AB0N43_26795 [Streptomyces pseudogriseolus]|uniref:hypothetical protein n=1 Tax=Streptomyces pseudogriseolus TaxID=36817 RepID=UPI0034920979